MKKLLLRFTIIHPGDNEDEVLTSKVTLKVVLDEEKMLRNKFIEMRHFSDEESICTAITLYVESYEIKEKKFTDITKNYFQLDSHKSISGIYFVHLYAFGKNTELQMEFPEILS